jgi:hypothetical protein
MCQLKECVQLLQAANFVRHELKTDFKIGCIQRQGLAMWRYSVLRLPGLLLSKDMKMKIYSIAWLYSLAGYVAE